MMRLYRDKIAGFYATFEIYNSQGRYLIQLIFVTPPSRQLYASSYSTLLAVLISHF